ncbi:hypothetical protein [Vibrio sonorensis]|uniref:hypothetical protein n=1 Tax=Vibrio sonorensis TaxID=1004316 RepID=UPI0008D93495|nr:hypothetical protein [Vibrio sonorensis]
MNKLMEINPKTLKIRSKWVAPTTQEVNLVWAIIAWKYGKHISKIHEMIGVSERSPRRWRAPKSDGESNKSNIKYCNWALLIALVTGKSIIEKSTKQVSLDYNWIMKVDNYESPSLDVVKQFIGLNSFTGLSRNKLAQVLGIHGDLLAKRADGMMDFHLWAGILMHLGVEPSKLLDLDYSSITEKDTSYTKLGYEENEIKDAYARLKRQSYEI